MSPPMRATGFLPAEEEAADFDFDLAGAPASSLSDSDDDEGGKSPG